MHTPAIVPWVVPVHVVAGGLALVFGYVALYAAKGATLHRKTGILFVYAMLTMSLTGAVMEALITRRISVSVVAGLVTFYFVTTALLTVRPRLRMSRGIDAVAMVFGSTLAVLAFKAGVDMAQRGRPEAAPCFIFGLMALLAAAGDLRLLRAGDIQGPRRLARHLWRMCFAMWIAAASFFWGPPRRVPEVLRIPALLAVAVLLPIGVMLYWLWRIRVRKAWRGAVLISASEAPALSAAGR